MTAYAYPQDRLKALAQQGAYARMYMRADVQDVETPNVIATLAGQSAARIVLNSHTDGANALQDNGPLAMLAIARYFASLPIACPIACRTAGSRASYELRAWIKMAPRECSSIAPPSRAFTKYEPTMEATMDTAPSTSG